MEQNLVLVNTNHFGKFVKFSIFIVIVIVLYLVVTEHAVTSHATQIQRVEQCFNDPTNQLSSWFTDSRGRYSQYCIGSDNYSYWRIFECTVDRGLVLITQFGKRGTANIQNYINNKGYQPFEKPLPCS